MATDDRQNRLLRIPKELIIEILHVDDSICVIVKPANLRSVPGHANPPPNLSQQGHGEDRTDRAATASSSQSTTASRNAQACWITAVKSFGDSAKKSLGNIITSSDELDTMVLEALARLANTKTADSVPRKWKSFLRHFHRFQKQIIPSNFHHPTNKVDPNINPTSNIFATLETLAQRMFQQIEERYRPLLRLPEPSPLEDSAMGQLILMGYGDRIAGSGPPSSADTPQLYAVHRLDCETSGVMVFARNEHCASVLSQAWRREGDGSEVKKIYWAKVHEWPPYQKHKQTQGMIDLPLASSNTERIKWQVQLKGGKPSTTLWKVLSADEDQNRTSAISTQQQKDEVVDVTDTALSSSYHILLELTPLTGRTHQLRIHCAHVGSGIVGDSLYGTKPVQWTDTGNNQLCLHAYQLQFPHPDTGELVQFSSPPKWV